MGKGEPWVATAQSENSVDEAARARAPRNPGSTVRRFLRFAALFASVATIGFMPMSVAAAEHPTVVVGSKRFTESYILGEIVKQTFVAAGRPAVHKQGLGNTGILEQALASGAVDLYPEYTGTIVRELLKREGNPSLDELNRWLAPRGLRAGIALGFNNTYALAMSEAKASSLGISRISDLATPVAAQLVFGLSHEFMERGDGWPALRKAYGLAGIPRGLDHGLAYEAVADGRVDVIDVYSTDAKLGRLGLRVLEDDRAFFPKYDAVLLMRAGLDATPLARLAGAIDARTMIEMNGEVELDGRSFAEVAARFLAARGITGAKGAVGTPETPAAPGTTETPEATHEATSKAAIASAGLGAGGGAGAEAAAGASAALTAPRAADATSRGRPGLMARLFAPDLARLTVQHLLLVFGSLAAAIVVAVPVGVAAWRWPGAAGLLLGTVAVLQTVPSLALLAFLIAIVGSIGLLPALIALFVYALLPIVRNTHAGLTGVTQGMAQAALSLGLTRRQALTAVQLPLAAPTILAGIKIAAVINVGTATMAAFIGAGGFGERIVAGLAVNDSTVMLAGALPAAVLAIAVQLAFDAAERWSMRGRLAASP